MNTSTQYVAFLRGINIGTHTVKMDVLQKAFESLGFTDVHTVLATGNVVFESELSAIELRPGIEAKLEEVCGFAVPTMLRAMSDVRVIAELKPFKDVPILVGTRLYVSFLYEEQQTLPTAPRSTIQDFEILKTTSKEIFSILNLSHTFRTGNLMRILGDTYGKNITTRSWNTIYRILKLEK